MVEQQPRIALGGVHLQGVKIGIVLHQCHYPHPMGFISNAQTWNFPVHYGLIPQGQEQSNPHDALSRDVRLYDAFVTQARELLDDGCTAIVAGDGELAHYQSQLMDDLQVPVISSPLYQYAMVRAVLPPEQSVGIITLDKSSLHPPSLQCASITPDTPIIGLEQGHEFHCVLTQQKTTLNMNHAMTDVFDAVDTLLANHPSVGAILMECANLSPFSHGVHHRTGLPVYDTYTLVNWLGNSLHPTYYGIPYDDGPHGNNDKVNNKEQMP